MWYFRLLHIVFYNFDKNGFLRKQNQSTPQVITQHDEVRSMNHCHGDEMYDLEQWFFTSG